MLAPNSLHMGNGLITYFVHDRKVDVTAQIAPITPRAILFRR